MVTLPTRPFGNGPFGLWQQPGRAIEICPAFVDVAVRRWEQATELKESERKILINFGVKIDYARLLFSPAIESAINASPSTVETLEGAIDATVLVATNVDEMAEIPSSSKPPISVIVDFKYTYGWDLFHHTLSSFSMQWTDQDTGQVLASGTFSGGSFDSYVGIVQGVVRKILRKAGIE